MMSDTNLFIIESTIDDEIETYDISDMFFDDELDNYQNDYLIDNTISIEEYENIPLCNFVKFNSDIDDFFQIDLNK